jgi:hypothetical protein
MSDDTSTLERYIAVGTGVPLLLIGMSLFGWGVRLAVTGLFGEADWPPGLGQLLLPIAITSLLVGLGGWRLLLTGVPERIGRFSIGRLIAAGFGVAAVVGAVI